MPSAFHTSNEQNSSHKKTDDIRGLGQLKNFNKGKLMSTLMRSFHEASADEEDRRWSRGRSDSAEDTEASGSDDTVVDVQWPLSPWRMRLAGL
jgi:hypothetical protein